MKFLPVLKEEKVRGFVITLYSVGVAGILLPPTRELFIALTPSVLLLSFSLILYFHHPPLNSRSTAAFLLIYLISFFVEVAGVKYGFIFGEYSYGKGLGIKLLDTPLLIGLNWVMLVYCTAVIADKIPAPAFVKITAASLLMVLYDFIMEHAAPGMKMWSFEGGYAPLRNYISWFLLAFLFQSGMKAARIEIVNRIAPLVFYCQGIFFLVILIIFKLAK
ncbi:MAG: carotenoid biosynthesis protein [Bacteroidales bacterium]|jgi:putative membrane protein|nr:carotenoid biosynthesis protein [Bacteroidales bacterium]